MIERFLRASKEERHELGMERGLDLRDDGRRDGVEAGRRSDLIADAAQEVLCIQTFAKKPPVEAV